MYGITTIHGIASFLLLNNLLLTRTQKINFNYLAFFIYKFFVLALSDVNNKTNIVPNKPENTIVSCITSTNSLGIELNILNKLNLLFEK